ncbi:MAG TPA: hypothetical protein VGS09_07510 [Actinomycetota bacterium]|jgi:hypothetical protein|nr:hypothetical protein [Actinomycetota bacterium]
MDDVGEVLRRAIAAEMPQPSGLERVHRTARHRRIRQRIGSGIVAALVALAGLALAIETFDRLDQPERRSGDERLGSQPLDVSILEPAWTAEVSEGSWVSGVLQDSSRILVPTTTGAVAFPKDCEDPCQPLWTLEMPGTSGVFDDTELVVDDGVVVAVAGGGVAVVESDCRTDGGSCQPLWRAEPPARSNGYLAPVVGDGVVRVLWGMGEMPDHHVRAAAFPTRCRTDGGTCAPTWTAELGVGTAHVPGKALNGVFYQQVGPRMLGFRADCGTGGATCGPDFVIEATRDQSTQAGSLYGPVGRAGELVVSSGDGNLYAYGEHCGTSCSPLWVGPVADYLEGFPVLAGDLVVVSSGNGLTAFPLGCGSGGERCEPRWTAPLERYSSVGYADERVVVAADHFRRGTIVVFPTDCSGDCAPLWSAPANGEVHGVASDGTTVFAAFPGQEIRGYPLDCSDPCAPVWGGQVRGDVWWILLDSEQLVAAGRLGELMPGVALTVFD